MELRFLQLFGKKVEPIVKLVWIVRSISCTADAELPCQCNRLLITWRYSRRMTTQTPTFSLALLVQNEPLRNCDSLNRRLRKIDRHEDVLNAQLFHGEIGRAHV